MVSTKHAGSWVSVYNSANRLNWASISSSVGAFDPLTELGPVQIVLKNENIKQHIIWLTYLIFW